MSKKLATHLNAADIKNMDRVYRLRLINSITGYKSANLLGTVNKNGVANLGTFSSVTHMGSHPPLVGFFMRPSTVPRHTLENILSTKQYTINHIAETFTDRAHYCSAKFDRSISEFEACGLTEWYDGQLVAPYVLESPIRLGMQLREKIDIPLNGTCLIIGEIQQIHLLTD